MSVYEGHGVTLHHADCLDVLRSLPDCSVDSVVCDPPYNLSFMAKPWDAYEGREDAGFAYWLSGLIDGEGHFAIKAHSRGTHAPYFQLKMRADERGTLDRIRRLLGVGVVSIESKEPNPMAKYVIQDKAGCQRLVDLLDKYPLRAKKQLDYWTWREAVCEWTSRPRGNRWHGAVDNAHMAELRSRLMENRAYTDVPWSGHEFQDWCRLWATECLRVLKPGGHLLAFGGTRTWHRLACAVEDAGFEVRDSIAWLYGSGFPKSLDVSKAIDKAAGAEREVVGPSPFAARKPNGSAGVASVGLSSTPGLDLTAPATDAARTWQGWGTALKPAFEPVVVARKPLVAPDVNVLEMVESELRNRLRESEIRWTTRRASGAEKPARPTSSSSTPVQPTAGTSAVPADASETPSGARQTANGSEPRTAPGEKRTESMSAPTTAGRTASSETPCSTPMAESAPVVASDSISSSPSTTSTAEAPSTGRPSTARSTPNSDEKASQSAIESFAGIATGLTGSRAHVLIERLPDGSFVWPDGLPRLVKGGPLTVAANVLAHGTGALNIDGCRVTGATGLQRPERRGKGETGGWANYEQAPGQYGTPDGLGRWPANVVLDESQAAALDEQSGERPGFATQNFDGTTAGKAEGWGNIGAIGGERREGFNDTGGASRFFYVAKADATERPRVNGTAHPTVKPLSLMRWLVRLVTPPGGTVLEPFAGSGTTVEACIVEGFQCIAIEREADYLPLIRQRIDRRRDPVEALRGQAADLGLFDLLGGEGA